VAIPSEALKQQLTPMGAIMNVRSAQPSHPCSQAGTCCSKHFWRSSAHMSLSSCTLWPTLLAPTRFVAEWGTRSLPVGLFGRF